MTQLEIRPDTTFISTELRNGGFAGIRYLCTRDEWPKENDPDDLERFGDHEAEDDDMEEQTDESVEDDERAEGETDLDTLPWRSVTGDINESFVLAFE